MSARTIALTVKLNEHDTVESETVCNWPSPYLLAIATTLPAQGLALEVHSAFVGHAGVTTSAVHLVLGPVGDGPITLTDEHDHEALDPQIRVRECAYEHINVLLEVLKDLYPDARAEIPDDAFGELERVGGQ
jgi:hypothetical protein